MGGILKGLAACAVACVMAAPAVAGVGATQAWVTNYVTQTIAGLVTSVSTGGATTISVGGVELTLEDSTEPAIILREPTAAGMRFGFTNGEVLAYDGKAGCYRAGNHRAVTSATSCRLDICADGGALTNGPALMSFEWCKAWPGLWVADGSTSRVCRVARTLIQPTRAAEILGR